MQWRIIYDFNPTEYLQDPTRFPLCLSEVTGDGELPGSSFVATSYPFQKIILAHVIMDDNNQPQAQSSLVSTQLPKVGEWTRVEIGHEKVDEKYFLALSVGGREVGRKEVSGPELRNLTDVKVYIGHDHEELRQPGFVRRLVILEKQ